MTDNYEDIINLPHHVSTRHPQMSMMNRAAQFAPFAALTGHAAAIEETARLTESQQELADEDNEILNQKMAYLREAINEYSASHCLNQCLPELEWFSFAG